MQPQILNCERNFASPKKKKSSVIFTCKNMEEEKIDKTPDLKYAQMKFSLGLPDALCPPEKKAQIHKELMEAVKEQCKFHHP